MTYQPRGIHPDIIILEGFQCDVGVINIIDDLPRQPVPAGEMGELGGGGTFSNGDDHVGENRAVFVVKGLIPASRTYVEPARLRQIHARRPW